MPTSFIQLILEAVEAVHGPDKEIRDVLALLRQQSMHGLQFEQKVNPQTSRPIQSQPHQTAYQPIPAALPPMARSASMLADLWPPKKRIAAPSIKVKSLSEALSAQSPSQSTPRFLAPLHPPSPRSPMQSTSPVVSLSTRMDKGKGKDKVPQSPTFPEFFSSSSSSSSSYIQQPILQPEKIPLPPSPSTGSPTYQSFSSFPDFNFLSSAFASSSGIEEIPPDQIPLPPSPNELFASIPSQPFLFSSQPRLERLKSSLTLSSSSPLLSPATPPAEQVQHLATLLIKRGLLQVGAITTTSLGMLRNLPQADDAILGAVLSIISAGIDALEIPGHIAAIKTSAEKTEITVARLCEALAQTYVRSEGVACQITRIAGVALPLGATIPAPVLSLASNLLEVMNSIRAVIRFVGVHKVATTLIVCLSNMFELNGVAAPNVSEFESTWKQKLATGYSATKIPDVNFSALVWFCYKYKRGISGIIKTHTERLALPVLALGGTILGMVILTSSVPIAGQIVGGIIGTGVVAMFSLGFSIYRTGKYIQSRNAFREILKDPAQRITLNATRAQLELLAACLSAKHTIGGFLKWGGGTLDFTKNPHSIVPGATIGDFFRLKLSLMLMHFFLEEDRHYDGVFDDPIENHMASKFLADAMGSKKTDTNPFLLSNTSRQSGTVSAMPLSLEIDEDDMFDDRTFFNYIAGEFNKDLLYSFFVGVLAIIIKDISNMNWNKKLKSLSNLYSQYIDSVYHPRFGFTGQATVQTEIKIKVIKEFFELIRVNM